MELQDNVAAADDMGGVFPVPGRSRFRQVQRIAALDAAARVHAESAREGQVYPHWDVTNYADKLLDWLRRDD